MKFWLIVILFLTFSNASKISKIVSAALIDCFLDNSDNSFPASWGKIMLRYFPAEPKPRPSFPRVDWPDPLDDDVGEIFKSKFVVGLAYVNFFPNFYLDTDGVTYKGYEHDLLFHCVFPRIKSKYSLSDSEFVTEIKVLRQPPNEDYFEHILDNLSADRAHLFTSTTELESRKERIDYSNVFIRTYQSCVRTKFETTTSKVTKAEINDASTKIISLTGATSYWVRKQFPMATVSEEQDTHVLFDDKIKNSPTSHFVCSTHATIAAYLETNMLTKNYTYIADNLTTKSWDDLGWAFAKDKETYNYLWMYITFPTVGSIFLICCFCCVFGSCVIILVLAAFFLGSVVVGGGGVAGTGTVGTFFAGIFSRGEDDGDKLESGLGVEMNKMNEKKEEKSDSDSDSSSNSNNQDSGDGIPDGTSPSFVTSPMGSGPGGSFFGNSEDQDEEFHSADENPTDEDNNQNEVQTDSDPSSDTSNAENDGFYVDQGED